MSNYLVKDCDQHDQRESSYFMIETCLVGKPCSSVLLKALCSHAYPITTRPVAHGGTVAAGVGFSAEPRTSASGWGGGDWGAWKGKEMQCRLSAWIHCARIVMSA